MSYVPQDTSDAALLAERITPRLSHSNSSVVLTCIRVVLYLMNYVSDEKQILSLCRKLSPPLVTLLAKGPEVQYLALRNALLILQRRPEVLRNDIRVFFCKYNDPIYVKVTKLELIFMLATEENINEVLTELKESVFNSFLYPLFGHCILLEVTILNLLMYYQQVCHRDRYPLCAQVCSCHWQARHQD